MLVYVGIRESKRASNAMVIFKLAIIFVVIGVGAFFVDPDNWDPFAPNGITGILKGVSGVFFAYIGFDAITTTAEEARNPRRDLPRAMFLSLAICTVLYILIALVLTGMVNHSFLQVGDPLAFVFGPEGANIPWLRGVVAISAVVAMTTVLLVFQLGQPRIWMAMSRDGLLPPVFAAIHPRFKTPWFATLMTGLLVAVPALFMNLTEVTDLTSIGTLFAFVLVSIGVIVLRRTRPDLPRGFRTPLVPLVPILAVLACLWLMLNLSVETWLRFVVWMVLGVVVYFAYGRRHSVLGQRIAAGGA
jgi:amino acid transporter